MPFTIPNVPKPPQNLGPKINTPRNELDPGLSLGGFALYFSSDRRLKRQHPRRPQDAIAAPAKKPDAEYNLFYTTSREVFEQIAIGQDAGHHPATLAALERKGLIVAETATDRQGWPPVTIKRYYVPVLLHMQWCAWCSENVGDDPVEEGHAK